MGRETLIPSFPASFWGEFETKFFSSFGSLFSKTEPLNLGKFHQLIVDIKKYVTEHLYKIARKESDLLHQLKLIKDYYLMGRGDQFEEFIKECRILSGRNHLALNAKDLNRAFQMAAQSLNLGEDLEQFSFCSVVSQVANGQMNDTHNQTVVANESLHHVTMHYKGTEFGFPRTACGVLKLNIYNLVYFSEVALAYDLFAGRD